MSLNQSTNIAISSMRNNQYALTVVAQNISNIHTEGYARQRANFATNEPLTSGDNVISVIKGMNGARIDSLTDYIDDAAFNDLIGKNSDSEYYNKLADAIGELEDISDDLGDSGLNAILNDFYTASANLEKYPADAAIRQQFALAAESVAEKFNSLSKRFQELKTSKLDTIQSNVSHVNTLLNSLAQANKTYLDTEGSSSAKSDINNILKDLSSQINLSTKTNANGTVNVYIGSTAVVEGAKLRYTLGADCEPDAENAVNFKLISTENEDYVIDDGVTEYFRSGSLKAYIDVVNGKNGKYTNINDMMSYLDQAANDFAKAVNEIQTYGHDGGDVFAAYITTDPATGDFILERSTADSTIFSTNDGSDTFTAANISLNTDVYKNPLLIAAARIDLSNYRTYDEEGNVIVDENGNPVIDESWIYAIGNSDNAREFTSLQNKKICSYDGVANNCTLSDYLLYNASKVGAEGANASTLANTYQDIANSAAENYSNLIGVNLDEELSDMIRYQRAYEASAKLFTVIDNLTSLIINMV